MESQDIIPITFFTKYKYYILIFTIIIVLGLVYYYYKIKPRTKNVSHTPLLNEFIVTDIKGNLIKVKGEKNKLNDIPKKHQKKVEPKMEELEESSENNNTAQFNLTKSEMDDLVEKLN